MCVSDSFIFLSGLRSEGVGKPVRLVADLFSRMTILARVVQGSGSFPGRARQV